MDQKIKSVALRAKNLGLTSFILMAKQPGDKNESPSRLLIHIENTSIKDAMDAMIAGFRHVISLEIDNHPEYTEPYKDLFRELDTEFIKLIKSNNQKFIEFKNKKK